MDDLTHLLHRAADGDQPAFSAFVRATQADVWRLCAHLVDVATADDLTQETYVRAMGGVGRFRGDGTARTWLLAIARRTCADELRRRTRRRGREVAVDPATMEWTPGPDEAAATELHELVAGLAPDRREAVVLTQVLGLSYREAAATVGVPVGTIRSRVARAREDLAVALAAEDITDVGDERRRHG